jgi:hypothetical protein
MNNTIAGLLEGAGLQMDEDLDELGGLTATLNAEVKYLRQQLEENSKRIEHLERLVNPIPPRVARINSTETEYYDSDNYKPQHPFFNAAAQSRARKTYCWLTQSSDDKKNKAKQDNLVREYYDDKTTEARREKIIKELIAMAKCKDQCQLQGNAILSSKGCADDDAVRQFVMKRLESSEFHDKKTNKKTVLTRRRARTREESSAKSFRE